MFDSCPQCGSDELSDGSELPGDEVEAVCNDCGRIFYSLGGFDSDQPDTELQSSPDTPEDTQWSEVSKISDGTEANVSRALEYLEQFSDELSVSDSVRKLSAEFYAEAMSKGLTAGRSMKLVVTVCLRAAMHKEGAIRPDLEISKVGDLDQAKISNFSREITHELGIENSIPTPEDHISYLSDELSVDAETEDRSREILRNVEQASTSGKSPVSYAAAALYLGSEGDVTQREVAIASGVTTETVRVRLRDLEDQNNSRDHIWA
ncbi:transcription initiation factor IIB family protein [Haladaptatus sp. F3-133]|uniref:Transcription initiation factor IIB n=1 Tax=Halorutilus salinus TaxID=2487751 RepID=A0A9Q4GJC8_9EURY|nr:transcription initiation factor IIB family protein [Halorutilus salinus]MCX2819788.1 transcription initiation factor IIB family protein [Halorutilus salinus]